MIFVVDPVSRARAALDAGDTPDQVACVLIQECRGPIDAIKALRLAGNMHLGEAKEIVHRNLPPEHQAAAERLWDEAIRALENEQD
jgi:hypothetical protein